MVHFKSNKWLYVSWFIVFSLSTVTFTSGSALESSLPRPDQLVDHKSLYDDPRSMVSGPLHPSKVLPSEEWAKLVFDKKEMSELWENIVGFKAQDRVGKIAPEVKPGKYTYKDIETNPGLRELMIPQLRDNYIKAGGPPFAGNISEFEIVPTIQHYHSLPVSKQTQKNIGKTKQDEQGYIISSSFEAGIPFPRPSGKYKAQQIIYNNYQRCSMWDCCYRMMGGADGIDKKLKPDFLALYYLDSIRLSKRSLFEPYGWYDQRAQNIGEERSMMTVMLSPRDVKGFTVLAYNYEAVDKVNQSMSFLPTLRRIKKMSATDTQDPINGQDLIYDDTDGFGQKLNPDRYPYEYKLIAEREYLVPVSIDGTGYIDTKDGYSYKNLKMMRRPMYVIELIQQDRNYVYSKRIIYIDAESFYSGQLYNYDQKGRLYRSDCKIVSFLPECGMLYGNGAPSLQRDHIDTHATLVQMYAVPVMWERNHFSLRKLMKNAK